MSAASVTPIFYILFMDQIYSDALYYSSYWISSNVLESMQLSSTHLNYLHDIAASSLDELTMVRYSSNALAHQLAICWLKYASSSVIPYLVHRHTNFVLEFHSSFISNKTLVYCRLLWHYLFLSPVNSNLLHNPQNNADSVIYKADRELAYMDQGYLTVRKHTDKNATYSIEAVNMTTSKWDVAYSMNSSKYGLFCVYI